MERYPDGRGSQLEAHDTIEVELSMSGVRESATSACPASASEDALQPDKVWTLRTRMLAVSALMLVALASVAYGWATHTHPATIAASGSMREAAVEPAHVATVRFANPFDTDEAFEFAAGTTDEAARAAVAEILLQRAQERRASAPKERPARKSAKTENALVAENSRRP